jgi:hypothetical protein
MFFCPVTSFVEGLTFGVTNTNLKKFHNGDFLDIEKPKISRVRIPKYKFSFVKKMHQKSY